MSSSGSGRPPVTTVHLVYPHGPGISTPDAIGRNLGRRLEQRYRVVYHDWDARYRIEPESQAALVGHPHPLPGTVFRRSISAGDWDRVLLLAPYVDDPAQVAFEDPIVAHCDLFLAITGPYWFSAVERSMFSHWAPKMVHLDLAIDRADFPPVKSGFGPVGHRRLLYIGHAGRYKNAEYLGEIARLLPGVEFGWMGSRGGRISGVESLGWQDFEAQTTQALLTSFDFMITVGRADANPTTILEAMAWGLIPVCTPQSGYEGVPGIINVPLDDAAGAAAIIRGLQSLPGEDLGRIQEQNWRALETIYTWDRFAGIVAGAVDAHGSPRIGRESLRRRARLALAAQTSWHTSVAAYAVRRARGRLRLMSATR